MNCLKQLKRFPFKLKYSISIEDEMKEERYLA